MPYNQKCRELARPLGNLFQALDAMRRLQCRAMNASSDQHAAQRCAAGAMSRIARGRRRKAAGGALGARGEPRGTVALFGGRAEFIEKYFETIGDCSNAVSASRRSTGAGKAARSASSRNRDKGHIDDFSLYERDLSALVTECWLPIARSPWYGARPFDGRGDPADDRTCRTLPVRAAGADLADDRLANLQAPALARFAGRGARLRRARRRLHPRRPAKPSPAAPFEDNPLTSDPVAVRPSGEHCARGASVGLGFPTIGWVHAAFRLMRRFEDRFSRAHPDARAGHRLGRGPGDRHAGLRAFRGAPARRPAIVIEAPSTKS